MAVVSLHYFLYRSIVSEEKGLELGGINPGRSLLTLSLCCHHIDSLPVYYFLLKIYVIKKAHVSTSERVL